MNKTYKIEKLDHFGRGIVNIDGKIGFVTNATIGDEVVISKLQEKKKFFLCDVKEYAKKSDLRKKSFCKYSSICGGCDIGDLIYEEQLKFKKEKVENIVKKYFKQYININDVLYDKDTNYRNKITLHVKNGKIGLYKRNSNDLVEIDSCLLVNDKINEIITKLKDFIKDKDVNKIIIKCTNLDEIMLIFYGNVSENDVLKSFDCNSIFINDKCISNKYIYETIGDFKFALSKDSFFQVNRYNTINLYNEIVRKIKKENYKSVLDLYCGTGTIGIFASKYVSNVIGIEEVEDAIESANINKKINNICNIEFICGKVEDNICKFKDIDLIVTDPPRSGMDKKTVENILEINPRTIIYVSCDIMTLVRDLNYLKEKYNILEITPVDMFPNTAHCESVTVL